MAEYDRERISPKNQVRYESEQRLTSAAKAAYQQSYLEILASGQQVTVYVVAPDLTQAHQWLGSFGLLGTFVHHERSAALKRLDQFNSDKVIASEPDYSLFTFELCLQMGSNRDG